jgi:Regulator of chromosome condensation (RCC1) repeat
MTLTTLASTVLVLSAVACVARAPISQSPCPCPQGMGYICCDNRCVLPSDPTCGSTAGMSGAAGLDSHDTAGAGGSSTGGTGGAAGLSSVDAGGTPVDAGQVVSRVVSVGIGAAHACIVRANGTIECRGSNDKGQATPPAGSFLQVVAGAEHTCAQVQDLADRTKNGAWVCWGDNTYGQAPPSFGESYDVTAGGRHTCYTDSNDKIVCLGDNSLGQTSAPTVAAGYSIGALSAGRNHTCALVQVDNTISVDGTMAGVRCWGDNSLGQSTPPADLGTNPQLSLASGGDHTCASNYSFLTCWGANDVGQSTEPVGSLLSLSLATGHSCAMPFGGEPADRIQCWGTGWGTSISTPPTGKFSNIFAGDYINCALPDDMIQPLLCWGQTYESWY